MTKNEMLKSMISFYFDEADHSYYNKLNKLKSKKLIENIYELFSQDNKNELVISFLKMPVNKQNAVYGYRGGGRKKKSESDKVCQMLIYGKKNEIEQVKEKAKLAGKTTSRFIFDSLLK